MKKFISMVLVLTMLLNFSCLCAADGDVISIQSVSLLGKMKHSASEYGDDLEIGLVNIEPTIGEFSFAGDEVWVNGQADFDDTGSSFNIVGTAFKTYDNHIVCDAYDSSGNFDVLFLCVEKRCQYNDYILYRNHNGINDLKGDYGFKLYLMKKGTRDIYLLEDPDVVIPNCDYLLSNLTETGYSSLNWFVNCFSPIQILIDDGDGILPASELTTNTYTFTDTEIYAIGSDRIYLGFVLYATNVTPALTSQTTFSSGVSYSPTATSTNPAYANPQRAADMFRVSDIGVTALIGQGNYLQSISWGAAGTEAPSLNSSISFGVTLSAGAFGVTLDFSPSYYMPITIGSTATICNNSNCSYPNRMPRKAQTTYTGLTFINEGDNASLNTVATKIAEATDVFDCYQTNWTFNIYRKNSSGYYAFLQSGNLYCTSYFNSEW